MSESGSDREYVVYKCGGKRFDDGPGEAPDECPTCGAGIVLVAFEDDRSLPVDDEPELMTDGGEPQETGKEQLENPAWAIWLPNNERSSQDIVIAVNADDEDEAIEKAKEQAEYDGEVSHVDGPFQDAEASVYEFEFVTEHRERVVVEAPYEEYAKEEAQRQRDYRGELIQTLHTDIQRHPKVAGPGGATVDD